MNEQEINQKLAKVHCGSFTTVVYRTALCTNKDHEGVEVTKVVKAVARFGVNYSKMASVQKKAAAKAALGLAVSLDDKKLPWGIWKTRFLIENKGQLYVRLACPKNNILLAPKVLAYYANGQEITKEQAMEMTRPSEWTKKEEDLDVYVKKIEDIVSIKTKD